jgi:UrcA family protein
MKTISYGIVATAASALIGGVVMAQNLDEITIQATRNMSVKSVPSAPRSAQVKDISLSYVVNTEGLNLALHADVVALEKRVKDAALKACKDIGHQYPNSTPNDADCAKAASEKAMVRANELVAAAGKASAK